MGRKPAPKKSNSGSNLPLRAPSIRLAARAARARENLANKIKSKITKSAPKPKKKVITQKPKVDNGEKSVAPPPGFPPMQPNIQQTMNGFMNSFFPSNGGDNSGASTSTQPPPGFMYPFFNPFFMPGMNMGMSGQNQPSDSSTSMQQNGMPFMWPGFFPRTGVPPTATVSRPPQDSPNPSSEKDLSEKTDSESNNGSANGSDPQPVADVIIDVPESEINEIDSDLGGANLNQMAVFYGGLSFIPDLALKNCLHHRLPRTPWLMKTQLRWPLRRMTATFQPISGKPSMTPSRWSTKLMNLSRLKVICM